MADSRPCGAPFTAATASDPTASDRSASDRAEAEPRRRSIPLMLAGLLTITIALAGLLGPDMVVRLFDLPLGWLLVVAATGAGALLLLKPDRKRVR